MQQTLYQLRADVPYLGNQFVGWLYSDPTRALALAFALRSCPGAPYQVLTEQGQPVLDTSAIPGLPSLPGFGQPPGGAGGAGGYPGQPYPAGGGGAPTTDHPYGQPGGQPGGGYGQPAGGDFAAWLQQQYQNYQQYIPHGWGG